MTYSCRYKTNPSFPYNKISSASETKKRDEKADVSWLSNSSFFNSILSPLENIIGKKIEFDDILLVIIIYVIFTEKNKENNTLLLCLLFILLG